MRKLYIIILLALFTSCVTQEKVSNAELIAHAGGAIEGNIYTNSLEALENAVARGYKYIEFDFIFTSDSVLVAAHSWSDFNKMTGLEERGDSAPSLSEFRMRRIHGRYTPMTAVDVYEYFCCNDNLFLVVDKLSSPETLGKYFPGLKERMVVEAFSYNDYCALVDEGYFRVLYSCVADDLSSTLLKNLLFDKLFAGRRIEWVALHTSGLENGFFEFLDKVRLFNIALFTVDDYSDIPAEYRYRAKMIYTNTLLPE